MRCFKLLIASIISCLLAGCFQVATVVRVNPDAGAVAIESERDSAPVVLGVTERTEITINGQPARLSELRVGMRADASFCRESLVARSIAARTDDSRR